MSLTKKLNSLEDLKLLRENLNAERSPDRRCVAICSGTGCLAYKADVVANTLEQEIAKQGLKDKIELRRTGCQGFCEHGPIVIILPEQTCYLKVKPADVPEIVTKTLLKNEPVERLLFKDNGRAIKRRDEIPFYRLQQRLVIGNNLLIDPKKIEDYIAIGGYSALAKVLAQMSPIDVLNMVKQANLRGRGGGGFPAGTKWETTRNAPENPKYVIVNADEGDPGAYMDRSVLEGNPHSVLEGLIIGAYAIGSNQGFIYVRHEYPLAVENTSIALDQAREYGLLGKNILGSGFDFDVRIHRGAGAFVSGESSALMSAIEGHVGEPRPKYIHTSVKGIWNKPSNLNNVETWANVPFIINNGVEWFKKMGSAGNPGTKIFSLVGKVNYTGLIEVPMGITLREIVYGIGGGVPKNKKLKAVQTGGPSGGFLPESLLDLRVDFDELTKAGSMMGSGGMIVMDEDNCMVGAAKYYVGFLSNESCGKCVPCREGLRQMLKILNNITAGKGKEGDIELLEDISEVMINASLCALGSTAPYPVLSAIKYFREEFEEHIKEKRCRAGYCADLIAYYIDPERCRGCNLCAKNCPTVAISGKPKTVYVIDQAKCIKCGVCLTVCPERWNAVVKISGKPTPPEVPLGTKIKERVEGSAK
jgi:NADP-reducing hydrogenase subunit HndC